MLLVVFTDGEENKSSKYKEKQIRELLRKMKTRIAVIFYEGPLGYGRSYADKLVELSGRSLVEADSRLAGRNVGRDITPDFDQIIGDILNEYVISYHPSNSRKDGKFRSVKVKLPQHPDLSLRTRKGYFAPIQ